MTRTMTVVLGLAIVAAASATLAFVLLPDSASRADETRAPGAALSADPSSHGASDVAVPLHFERNEGQAHASAYFVARGPGPDVLLGTDGISIGGVTIGLADARSGVEPRAGTLLAARVDYFHGNDPDGWLTGVPAFADVVYPEAYDGIAVRYHGDQGALEQDFVIEPGADPDVIRLSLASAAHVALADGDLIVGTPRGDITLEAPVAYQSIAGERKSVDAAFELDGDHVSFALGAYDHTEELVIDPVISYASFLGGDMADVGNAIAAEAGGTLFVTGRTGSADFPPGETDLPGNDAFVVGIDPSQSGAASLVYKAYLGGNNQDEGFGIAAGPAGTVYVTGKTQSTDFPTVGAFDETNNAEDAFLTKIDPTKSGPAAIVYSTFLGGTGADAGAGVAVDALGRAHITGETASAAEFPLKNALDNVIGGTDGFLVTIDPAIAGAGGLVYGSYIGGDGADRGNGVAADTSNRALIAGETQSAAGFPLAGAFDSTLGGAADGFLLLVDPDAPGPASLLYGTYLGGSGADKSTGVARSSGGGALVGGATASADFPTRNPVFGFGGVQDGFVAKLAPALTGDASLTWSSFLGGADADEITGVASDPAGNAFVGGFTGSTDFPTTPDRIQPDQAMTDAFVSKIGESNPSTPVLLYSSYVGGSTGGPVVDMPFDRGGAIAADSVGSVAITGETFSVDVAASGPGFDTTCGSDGTCDGGANSDGWITRTSFSSDLQLTATAPAKPAVGKPFDLEVTVTAAGPDAATGVTLTSPAPSGVAVGPVSSSQGSCEANGQTVTCALGVMLKGTSATITVPLTPGSAGVVTLVPTVAAQEPDPVPGDNGASPIVRAASTKSTQPRLTIQTRRARVSKKGTVLLKLRCQTPAAGKCRGRTRITSTKRLDVERILATSQAKRVVKVADRRYVIRKGKARKLKLKLTGESRAVIRELGRLRVVITVTGRDSSGARSTVRRKIVIRAPAQG